MAQYHVEWTIEVEADSAEDAARKALAIQRNPGSIATVFEVRFEDHASATKIDLTEIDEANSEANLDEDGYICPDKASGLHHWDKPDDERQPTVCRSCGAHK